MLHMPHILCCLVFLIMRPTTGPNKLGSQNWHTKPSTSWTLGVPTDNEADKALVGNRRSTYWAPGKKQATGNDGIFQDWVSTNKWFCRCIFITKSNYIYILYIYYMLTMLINWQNVMEAEIIVKMDAALKPLVVFEHIISRLVSLLCCGAMEDVSSNHQCIRHRHHVIDRGHISNNLLLVPICGKPGGTIPFPVYWVAGYVYFQSCFSSCLWFTGNLAPVDIHIPATFPEHWSYTTWGAEVTKTEDVILYNLTLLVMRRSTRSDSWTRWHPKTNDLNLEITPIEKENHLNQTSILGFHVNFRGVNLYL